MSPLVAMRKQREAVSVIVYAPAMDDAVRAVSPEAVLVALAVASAFRRGSWLADGRVLALIAVTKSFCGGSLFTTWIERTVVAKQNELGVGTPALGVDW